MSLGEAQAAWRHFSEQEERIRRAKSALARAYGPDVWGGERSRGESLSFFEVQ